MTSHVAQLQQALEKLDVKQAEFLQQSDDLRKKYVRQINSHFDDLNTKAIKFIHEEAATLRNRKKRGRGEPGSCEQQTADAGKAAS